MPIRKRALIEFTPTQFDTAADKLKFYETFIRFVERGFRRSDFSMPFYRRLSTCFGHIAHYDRNGFYDVWFGSHEMQYRFMRNVLRWSSYGKPEFTYCDVERKIQEWLGRELYGEFYEMYAAAIAENRDRDQLKTLKGKYENAS